MPAFACKRCRFIVGEKPKTCPKCGGTSFSAEWVGYVEVLPLCEKCGYVQRKGEKTCPKCGAGFTLQLSEVAGRLGLTAEGRYALKVKE